MLNEKIRFLRKASKLSQVDLANKLGVTKQCISNWENDNIQPSVEMLVKISKLFNVTTDFMLDLASNDVIDVSKLSEEEKLHIKYIISDIIKHK